jgi:hypothetical protein
MKIVRLFRNAAWVMLAALAIHATGCAEMKEGEANVPDRLTRGLGGGGQFGGSPTGMFEPR